MTTVYFALGSNLGDRLGALRAAVRTLAGLSELRIDTWLQPSSPQGSRALELTDVASLYETSPVGGPADQPPYLNSVVRAQTSLAPHDLLATALSIENSLGRTRRERCEPRVIDIDLLFVGNLVIDSPTLTLPHPRLHERRFVLEPLSELAADLIHPLSNASIEELTRRLRRDRGSDTVMRIQGPEWALER